MATPTGHRVSFSELVKRTWPALGTLVMFWLVFAVPVLGVVASLVLLGEALRRRKQERWLPWRLLLVVSCVMLVVGIMLIPGGDFFRF